MKLRSVIAVAFVSLLVAYVLFATVYFPTHSTGVLCKQVAISIDDAARRKYVTQNELQQYLTETCGPLVGRSADELPLGKIENTMLNHPMLRTAEAWCSPDGVLYIEVTQREPILRVMGDENYYVDSDRRRMPVRATTAAYVPVITGRVSQRFASEELFDFVLWIEQDNYWRAQIEQIHVVNPQRIEIVPRVGTGIVILGSLDNYPGKLRKLKKLYQDGFSAFGWTDYSELDLRFKGQVVCRK